MKSLVTLVTGLFIALSGMAQTDSTDIRKDTTSPQNDTIRIGGMVIIKRKGHNEKGGSNEVTITRRKYTPSNLSTNWWIIDLGLSQINDQTNYPQAIANGYLPAGANEGWFNQRDLKSTNVNIWIFMQRLNMIKHVVNLKYGMGLELNNYRYTQNITYQEGINPLVLKDVMNYSKNKLAADYLTVPMMINFNFTPGRRRGFGFSAGASVGYLYSGRQKTISGELGKNKSYDGFDLNKWKVSYIGEVSLGPVRLYGSYATRSMFKDALDQVPYNIGIRLSTW